MPYFELSKDEISFPPAYFSDIDGLVAVGGDLSVVRLLLAYNSGIYFWHHPLKHIKWWSPDPRIVIKPKSFDFPTHRFHALKNEFTFTFNTSFEKVLDTCKQVYNNKNEMNNNWLSENAARSFLELHKMDLAKSVEIWKNNDLVGGLFGVALGDIFFGEYLFSLENHADEFAVLCLLKKFEEQPFQIVDLQKETMLVEGLDFDEISRIEYVMSCQENAIRFHQKTGKL